MRELAVEYYREGFPCGSCIIKAADEKYCLGLSGELSKAVSAASGGFGYGGLCAAAVSAILLFGYMFEEDTAKVLRIEFLDEFRKKYPSFNCCVIAGDCEKVVADAAEIADKIITSVLVT
ncbi:MAG: C-GCAxxG-C-C family protein [Clostridiales bacterium]|nr:C-GCAxxG-C-C family protein [Clostridiales bacterium]